VLVAVLWLTVAISAAALDAGLRSRTFRLATANALEHERAAAVAAAGIEHARSRLAAALDRGGRWSVARTEVDPWAAPQTLLQDSVPIGAGHYAVRLIDTGALLHLNRATEAQLVAFLRALRVDFGEADRLAQAIMDWRDRDELHRARGAERAEYERAGLPVVPRNGPFRSIEELRDVFGMSDDIWQRTRPHLTVLGSGLTNINSAPEPVLAALPGMTPSAVAAIIARRRQRRPIGSIQELTDAVPLVARQTLLASLDELVRVTTFRTDEILAVSTGHVSGSAIEARATAVLVRGSASPIVTWQRFE
jgi:general secretion pathway protein K